MLTFVINNILFHCYALPNVQKIFEEGEIINFVQRQGDVTYLAKIQLSVGVWVDWIINKLV